MASSGQVGTKPENYAKRQRPLAFSSGISSAKGFPSFLQLLLHCSELNNWTAFPTGISIEGRFLRPGISEYPLILRICFVDAIWVSVLAGFLVQDASEVQLSLLLAY
ncbi:hypothetical protein SDJN02_05785, partial [Cucurbita argyrosperma subsp. argyrosperma]